MVRREPTEMPTPLRLRLRVSGRTFAGFVTAAGARRIACTCLCALPERFVRAAAPAVDQPRSGRRDCHKHQSERHAQRLTACARLLVQRWTSGGMPTSEGIPIAIDRKLATRQAKLAV